MIRHKKIIPVYVVLCILTSLNMTSNRTLSKIWSSQKGLKVPESVLYDKKNNILYVSNINGQSTEKNNKGFISRVGLDGTIKTRKWITGLNAPKGMGIYKNRLFVTDIDRIHKIDISRSKIEKTYYVKGAQFLNDIAVDKKGAVYISDMTAHMVYLLKGEKVTSWLDLKKYKKANGLFLKGKRLFVGTARGIIEVTTGTKRTKLLIPLKGGIDGLKGYKKHSFLVSDWNGKVQLVTKGKPAQVLLDTSNKKINAADFEYIKKKKMVIIPTFFDNRVVAYSIK